MMIRVECWHLCCLCKHRKICKEERKYEDGKTLDRLTLICALYKKKVSELKKSNEQVEKWKATYELARQENNRLHRVIEDLTMDLDEAEEYAFCMQEKLSMLLKEKSC